MPTAQPGTGRHGLTALTGATVTLAPNTSGHTGKPPPPPPPNLPPQPPRPQRRRAPPPIAPETTPQTTEPATTTTAPAPTTTQTTAPYQLATSTTQDKATQTSATIASTTSTSSSTTTLPLEPTPDTVPTTTIVQTDTRAVQAAKVIGAQLAPGVTPIQAQTVLVVNVAMQAVSVAAARRRNEK